MGLASSQVTLLMLTARKADCELDMAIASNRKMALAREASNLSQEYYSRLQSKDLAFYSNGAYHEVNYEYLMGYDYATTRQILFGESDGALKKGGSAVLTDYTGKVVLSNYYADILKKFDITNGETFSHTAFPKILAYMSGYEQSDIEAVMASKELSGHTISMTEINSSTGEFKADATLDISADIQCEISKLIDFYKPIFMAAATNGWTTEYNAMISSNNEYIGDALVSGVFQLAEVFDNGSYYEATSLTYFVTTGLLDEKNDSDHREEVTAWYEAEKAIINDKETQLDVYITELSTELEAITTEMESIQSFIDDAVGSVFDWGAG